MKTLVAACLSCLALVACVPTGTPLSYRAMDTTSLWIEQASAQGKDLALIEAELGRRGETSFGTNYLGQVSGSAYGKALYSRSDVVRDSRSNVVKAEKDCGDFSSSADAQLYFLSAGGPEKDPNGLDRDGDGLACEWGATLKKIAKQYTATYRAPTPRASYVASRCYTGPRGGRYTITATGRKNYGGC